MPLIDRKKLWKPALLIAVIAAAGAWAVTTWLSYHRGLNRPAAPSASGFSSSEAQASQFRKRVFDELNLSWSQQWEIAKIRSTGQPQTPGEFADRLNQMQGVLSPEQRQIAAGLMLERFSNSLERRLESAHRVLPPDQYDIFEDRLKRNVQDFRSRINEPGRDREAGPR